ncbi:MAG: transglycosylase SLT domain-containing protein [Chloroflexota bacterium]|nr:transglycosylase SLT domain-containing protein [Chloroflexota bacterium]
MSNWYIFRRISQQNQTTAKQCGKSFYAIGVVFLITVGSWLVFRLLDAHVTNDFITAKSDTNSHLPASFSHSVLYWKSDILSWADEWNLDPILVATVMQIESCGDPKAISSAGAQGLFQVMPFHFSPGEDMLDPQINAQRGLAYLSDIFSRSLENIEHTLAGYNGGPSQIDQPEWAWPEETRCYVLWGTGIYQDAHADDESKPTLNAWLDAGDRHLCQQAEQNLGLP